MITRSYKLLYKCNSLKKNSNSFIKKLSKNFCSINPTAPALPPENPDKLQPIKIQTKLKYKFNYGVVKLPHSSKRDKGGEDAYAVHDGMLCVADGVGGWNESGVDPSKYSNELCRNVYSEFLRHGHKYYSQLKSIFAEACAKTFSVGSCTFVMCTLDLEKDYIHTLNLGDSGYMLIRGHQEKITHSNKALQKIIKNEKVESLEILHKSEEQQHSFNFPFQVGTEGDSPYDSHINTHLIKENDIIVLATDGLWDNLYENQILQILQPYYENSEVLRDINSIAAKIAEICERFSINQKYKSPFSARSGGLYLGGKPDDITIIVAQIVKN
jgi:protein phosphatase PTC7